MSVSTMLSRVTGFVRVWATAFALGATGIMSAYTVANNIPNMIFELVAGGIISSIFVPTFMEIRASRDEDSGWKFASHVFNLAVLALGLIAVIGTLFPEPFIWTQTFRMTGPEAEAVRATATFFFRFFAIQVVIYGAGSIIQALLNAQRKFLWPALGPVFNNLVVIGAMFAFVAVTRSGGDTKTAAAVLAIGTTLGVVAMFAVQVPPLMKSGAKYSLGLGLGDPELRHMLLLAVPTLIYVVTNLVAVSFRNASAFAVAPNGPSILTYAWIFYQLPYGILAVALATAVFTELSDAAGKKDWPAFKLQFARGLRANGVLMLPAAAVLLALATPLVSLFRVGAFQASDIPPVASALRWWAAGLIFYASTMFLLRSFYSLKDTRTPMLVNIVLSVLQVTLYFVLTTGIAGWPGLGVNGIPIADGIFFALSFVTLAALLRRKVGGLDLRSVGGTYARMLVASLVGGAVAWAIAELIGRLGGGLVITLVQLAAGGAMGLLVAWGLAYALRVDEISILTRFLGRLAGSRTKG